jgi:hypothetical protein
MGMVGSGLGGVRERSAARGYRADGRFARARARGARASASAGASSTTSYAPTHTG